MNRTDHLLRHGATMNTGAPQQLRAQYLQAQFLASEQYRDPSVTSSVRRNIPKPSSALQNSNFRKKKLETGIQQLNECAG